jgi:hypothetical protein
VEAEEDHKTLQLMVLVLMVALVVVQLLILVDLLEELETHPLYHLLKEIQVEIILLLEVLKHLLVVVELELQLAPFLNHLDLLLQEVVLVVQVYQLQ